MQTQGGDAAEKAITAPERRFVVSLVVDWDGTGRFDHPLSDLSACVSAVRTDRALRGSAPEEILIIEGSSAAELTLTLSGTVDGTSLAHLFSPFNEQSPFYQQDIAGREITYALGVETAVGTVWYPQFVGVVQEITPDRVAETVELRALDRVELLRRPVRLPPAAISEEHVAYGERDSQLARSHWVIDTALRQCGVSPTPYRPPLKEDTPTLLDRGDDWFEGCQFYVTGNGSWWPTIGYIDNPNASSFPNPGVPMFADTAPRHPDVDPNGPRPQALHGLGTPVSHEYGQRHHQGIIRYWCNDATWLYSTGMHYAGFTLNTTGPNPDRFQSVDRHNAMQIQAGHYWVLTIEIDKGKVRGRASYTRTSWQDRITTEWVPIPAGQDHVQIFVQWDNSTGTGSRMYVQAGSNSNGELKQYTAPVFEDYYVDPLSGRITLGQALSMSDIFYSNRNYVAKGIDIEEGRRPARYAAVLDHGLNRLSFAPARNGEAWDTITDVAAAEYGSVFWDENGIFRFWTLDTVLAKQQQVVRTLTIDDITGLKFTTTLETVRNTFSIKVKKKKATWSGAMYSSRDPWEFYVPGGSRIAKRFRVATDDALSPLSYGFRKRSSTGDGGWPHWTDDVTHGYVPQYFIDGQWKEDNTRHDLAEGVTDNINVFWDGYGNLQILVHNPWKEDMRFATDSGQPAFRISGTRILDETPKTVIVRDPESVRRYGPRLLRLSGDWYQDDYGARAIFDVLTKRTTRQAPITDAVTIPGDPRLQLGDTLTIRDRGGFGEEFHIQIYGIRREYSADTGLTDTLMVEVTSTAHPGTWDAPSYGRWDRSLIWS
ncbi:hypothetical protein GCM10012275_39280 [Longimycelium tulufanense]|uniref:Minor tail protein n=1 Tax=Longimycelium tulufanense TaxID=907463 RepID=A0A8J3FXQ8_9PSEU|nr:hypothetical protein [Longimycelium tulufanense]GGM64840.1 hypothetical protein GCM10012275_39280 [Longimycelium tulufanense]